MWNDTFSRGVFWLSSILVVQWFGRPSRILVGQYFCRQVFGRLAFWLPSILSVRYFGCTTLWAWCVQEGSFVAEDRHGWKWPWFIVSHDTTPGVSSCITADCYFTIQLVSVIGLSVGMGVSLVSDYFDWVGPPSQTVIKIQHCGLVLCMQYALCLLVYHHLFLMGSLVFRRVLGDDLFHWLLVQIAEYYPRLFALCFAQGVIRHTLSPTNFRLDLGLLLCGSSSVARLNLENLSLTPSFFGIWCLIPPG